MDFFGLFSGEEHESAASPVASGASSLERKIDRLMEALDVRQPDVADALPRHINDLVARGQKIEAIKMYREMTGLGLREAKEAVDGNAVVAPIIRLERKIDAILDSLGVSEDRSERAIIPTDDELVRLIRNGKKIEAIALYRERHRCGLKDAKDAVDALERELRNR